MKAAAKTKMAAGKSKTAAAKTNMAAAKAKTEAAKTEEHLPFACLEISR